jgi:hypothetical protein
MSRDPHTHILTSSIGPPLQEWIDRAAQPYIRYTTNQVMAAYILDMECKNNPRFAAFCAEQEQRTECRRLAVQSFLGRPMARLGRYPLLLEVCLSDWLIIFKALKTHINDDFIFRQF